MNFSLFAPTSIACLLMSTVVVYGQDVSAQQDPKVETRQTMVFPIRSASPVALQATLKQLYESAEGLALVADEEKNLLIIRGSKQQVRELGDLINVIDVPKVRGAASATPEREVPKSEMERLRKRYEASEQAAREAAAALRELGKKSGKLVEDKRRELNKLVTQSFTIRQELLRSELSEMEWRLKQARETLQRRQLIMSQIVDRRVSDLLNQDLAWESTVAPAQSRLAKVGTSGKSLLKTVEAEAAKRAERWNNLRGPWVLERTQKKETPLKLSFDGRTCRFTEANGDVLEGSVLLDVYGPQSIVIDLTDGRIGMIWQGIYELEKDLLAIQFKNVTTRGGRPRKGQDVTKAKNKLPGSPAAAAEMLERWSGVYHRLTNEKKTRR